MAWFQSLCFAFKLGRVQLTCDAAATPRWDLAAAALGREGEGGYNTRPFAFTSHLTLSSVLNLIITPQQPRLYKIAQLSLTTKGHKHKKRKCCVED
jgi:hypothetical protein